MKIRLVLFAAAGWFCLSVAVCGAPAEEMIREGLAAEARLDSRGALEFFLQADKARPGDATILQKIAQQYSDLIVEIRDEAEKKRHARTALSYAERAVTIAPENAVNVLSLAVCHGKLGVLGDVREKITHSRLVKSEAERALALDPSYAWAHHVLGRWHGEVASLGFATRAVVRVVYGGLPEASHRQAIEHLTRAVQLQPHDLAHHLELGFAYAAVGETGKARSAFEKGLALPSRKKHDEPAKQRARAKLEKLAQD